MKNGKRFYTKLLLTTMLLSFLIAGPAVFAAVRPTITVSTPTDNTVVTTNSVVISGYVTNTMILRVNGVGVAFGSSGFFSHTVSNLSEGSNSVRITATSSSGYTSNAYLTVTCDPDAIRPVIEITSHEEGDPVYTATPNIDGLVTHADTLFKVSVNGGEGTDVPFDGTGAFTASVQLSPGENVIVFTAQNPGLTVTKTLRLNYTKPALIYNLTVDGDSINDYITTTTAAVLLEGDAPEAGSVDIYLNDVLIPDNFVGGGFDAALSLTHGANRVAITAVGPVGSETREITIYYGDAGPQVYDVIPADNETVYSTYIIVKGSTRDADSLTVNGTGTSIASDGTFSRAVPLTANQWNSVVIVATSAGGAATTHTYNIYCETDPVIFLDEPQNGTIFHDNTVTVSGKVVNTKYSGLSVNGAIVYFNSSTGEFSTKLTLKPGDNIIGVAAENSAGIKKTANVTVQYLGGPGIINLAPDPGMSHSFNSDSVIVTGKVVNTKSEGLKINDTVVSFASDGSFSKTIALNPGLNAIKITATDGYSTSAETINVRYESGPMVVITSPGDGDILVKDEVTIRGQVLNTERNGLTINDKIISFNSYDGSFSADVELTGIENEFVINAYNGEMAAERTLRVYYSGVPGITVSSHSNGDVVDTADIIIEGTVFPANPGEITAFRINDVDALDRLSGADFRSAPVTLSSDENDIELSITTAEKIISKDKVIPSRTASRTISLTYNDGPSITVDSPMEGATVYTNMVTVTGQLKKADFNTLTVNGEDTDVSSGGGFSRNITLKDGKNEIELSASFGEASTTKVITVYYNTIAREGSEVRTEVQDGDEIKAFDDWIKIKLDKGSVGFDTESLLEVEEPSDIEDAPDQSAFVGPLFRLRWRGDDPVKPYRITLQYDDVVGEKQAHKISAFFYDTDEDEWQILGGVVDSKARTVSIETDKEGYYAAAVYYRSFDDIDRHWAQRDIEFLVAQGAIAGRTRDRFMPDDNVSRAEFVTFLVRTLGLQPFEPEDASYRDVRKSHWASPYVEAALRAGLVSGVSHDRFAPDRNISREEAAALLARAGNLKTPKDQEITKIFSDFGDAARISQWAREDAASAVKAKLMNGFADGTFSPRKNTTRAQAATMISRLSEVVNKNSRPR